MEDIYSYLKWRGDISLSESPFNEIDSLILSLISYVNFDGIVPSTDSNDSITLKEASDRYISMGRTTGSSNRKVFINKPPLLLNEAAHTNRYSMIQIGKHINQIDVQKEKQFSASTFLLSDDSIYVAFRGTDGTIVGWKEDFNMSFIPVIPAQTEAVGYLETVSAWRCGSIRIGGHSKGGNLAFYSGINCAEQIRSRILSIHNFDGPGLSNDVIRSAISYDIISRITIYLPQASVIGLILEHEGEKMIIKSNQFGIMQHDPFSWEVNAARFLCVRDLNRSSLLLEGIIKEWINKLDVTERECFVDALFGVLDEIGIGKVEDFSKVTNDRNKAFLKSIRSLPVETRQMLSRAIKLFFVESRNAIQMDVKEMINNRLIRIEF